MKPSLMDRVQCFFGRHAFVRGRLELTGATLDWAAQPTPCFEKVSVCIYCLMIKRERGFILPRRVVAEYYPAGESWPHDPKTGKRLEIAK